MGLDAVSLEGRPWLEWPGILAWSVEISGLGRKHLKMSQGLPAAWCPNRESQDPLFICPA